MSQELKIRRLSYADLPQVIAIERRAFPTPWSLAMFVLELSKTSGICLAAVEGETLVGYLICSRYDTVWHVMNVAVDADHQRVGLASALLAEVNRDVHHVPDGVVARADQVGHEPPFRQRRQADPRLLGHLEHEHRERPRRREHAPLDRRHLGQVGVAQAPDLDPGRQRAGRL